MIRYISFCCRGCWGGGVGWECCWDIFTLGTNTTFGHLEKLFGLVEWCRLPGGGWCGLEAFHYHIPDSTLVWNIDGVAFLGQLSCRQQVRNDTLLAERNVCVIVPVGVLLDADVIGQYDFSRTRHNRLVSRYFAILFVDILEALAWLSAIKLYSSSERRELLYY